MFSTAALAALGRQCRLRIPLLWLLLLVQLAGGARASRVASRAWVDLRPHAAHAAAATATSDSAAAVAKVAATEATASATRLGEASNDRRAIAKTVFANDATASARATANATANSEAAAGEAPTLAFAMTSLATDLGTQVTEGCVKNQDGDQMGCELHCGCGHMEQCYPKYVLLKQKQSMGKDVWDTAKLNVGVCGTAMPVLILLSGALFICLLSCVVTVRMYFQWQESLAIPGDGSEAHILMGKDSSHPFPPGAVPGAPGAPRGLFGKAALNAAPNLSTGRSPMPKAMPGSVAAASAAAKVPPGPAAASLLMSATASASATGRPITVSAASAAGTTEQAVPVAPRPEEIAVDLVRGGTSTDPYETSEMAS